MANSETGHTKNVTNFGALVSAVISYGAAYNPGRNDLKLDSLETLLNDANIAITEVDTSYTALKEAVSQREIAFDGLSKLAARIGNALEVSNIDQRIKDDAQTFTRKLEDGLATPEAQPETPAAAPAAPAQTTSHMSFDSRIANFEQLVQLLEPQKDYAPNEADLNPSALRTRLHQMKVKNSAAMDAANALGGARMVRDEVLYDAESGLMTIAKMVKKYVKSVFGAGSPQCQKIAHLRFMKPK